MTERFVNHGAGSLLAGCDAVQATISVSHAETFPDSGDFRLVVDSEIMLVTGVAGNVFTVERGQEHTQATSHALGTAVDHRFTAGAMESIAYQPSHMEDPPTSEYMSFVPGVGLSAQIGFTSRASRDRFNFQVGETITLTRDGGADEVTFTVTIPITTPNETVFGYYVVQSSDQQPEDEGYFWNEPPQEGERWLCTHAEVIYDTVLDSDNVTDFMGTPLASDIGYDGGARQGDSGLIADAEHMHDANYGGIFPGGTGSTYHPPGRWWQNYPQTIYSAPYEDLGVATEDGVLKCMNISLPSATQVIGEVRITSGATAMSGCTHIWLSIHNYHSTPYDGLLGQTADLAVGTSWPAFTTKVFTLPVPISIPESTMPRIFVGLMITATQHPSLMGTRIHPKMRPFAGGRVVEHDTGGLTTTAPATLFQSFVGSAWWHLELETGY